ncbi:MAG TPA: hypothetical protein VMY59_01000 [Candidatus Thermoplasmatota archaeon]|nr:hypothetical protein [Candidatus Thermoplasmatota archaeon]
MTEYQDSIINQEKKKTTGVRQLKQVRINRLIKKGTPLKKFLLLPDKNGKLLWTEVRFVTKNTEYAKKYVNPLAERLKEIEKNSVHYIEDIETGEIKYIKEKTVKEKNIYYTIPSTTAIRLNSSQFWSFMCGKALKQTNVWSNKYIDGIRHTKDELPGFWLSDAEYAKQDEEKNNGPDCAVLREFLQKTIIIRKEDITHLGRYNDGSPRRVTSMQELKICNCGRMFITANNKQFRCASCGLMLWKEQGRAYGERTRQHYIPGRGWVKYPKLTLEQYYNRKHLRDNGCTDYNYN